MWFILGIVHSPAGTSAAVEYRRARDRRRRGVFAAFGFVLVGAGLAEAARRAAAGGIRAGLATSALICVLLAGRCMWSGRDPERWLRGAAGEVATALVLGALPAPKWAVLHDRRVPGSRANLDHLVIGPSGVWVIDTKATRARVRAGWRTVRFGDRRLDTGPVKWEAQVVADRLGVPVRPLVVVHGDGLRRRGGRCGGVRVVPAHALLSGLRRHRWRLRPSRVAALADEAEFAFSPAGQYQEKRVGLRG